MSEKRWQQKPTPELLFELEAFKSRVDNHIAAYYRKKEEGASQADLAEHNQEIVEIDGMVGRDLKMAIVEHYIQELEAEQQSGSAPVLERLPEDEISLWLKQAEDYLEAREFHLAVAACNTVLRHNPDSASAFHQRGLILIFVSDSTKTVKKAMMDFSAAIRLEPDYLEAYLSRADQYSRSYQHILAVADYTEVLRLSPEHQRAYHERGLSFYMMKRYLEAIIDLDEALRLEPEDASTYYCRAEIYRDTGNYERALKDCEQAKLYDPGWSLPDRLMDDIRRRQAWQIPDK